LVLFCRRRPAGKLQSESVRHFCFHSVRDSAGFKIFHLWKKASVLHHDQSNLGSRFLLPAWFDV